jgi:hypothetical protein
VKSSAATISVALGSNEMMRGGIMMLATVVG